MKRGRKSSTRKTQQDEEPGESPTKVPKTEEVPNEPEHALAPPPPAAAKKGRRGSAKQTAAQKKAESELAHEAKQAQEVADETAKPSEPPPVLEAKAPVEADVENNHIMCPYLDTVNRSLLDFDFEKKCSISLQTTNIYCCLVCGSYFQGRSSNTHAYKHSVDAQHHVFINMHNRRVYCLPDGYEVFDASLTDIQVRSRSLAPETDILIL